MTEYEDSGQPVIVLASTSSWRQQLLVDAGIRCETDAPQVDEEQVFGAGPVATARARAAAKAHEVAARHAQALVIGADQVLWFDDPTLPQDAIGKPLDQQDWLRRLRQLRGRTHQLTTAVCLVAPAELGGREDFEVSTAVKLRSDLSEEELVAYVRWGEGAGCAGGYMVERRGAWLIEELRGDWYNVVGLPVLHLVGRLRARGWRLHEDGQGRPGLAWRSPVGAG